MRKQVTQFAKLMEARLVEKDPKRNGNSWGPSDLHYIHYKFINKAAKLQSITEIGVHGNPESINRKGLKKVAADVANYSMMLVDILSSLEEDA